MATKCPNLSDPTVNEHFQEMREAIGNFSYVVWDENNGNSIEKAPNGKPSILFNDLLKSTAIKIKAKAYGVQFKEKFGNWTIGEGNELVDKNGEPLSVYLGVSSVPTNVLISEVLQNQYKKKSSAEKIKITESFRNYIKDLRNVPDATIQKVL